MHMNHIIFMCLTLISFNFSQAKTQKVLCNGSSKYPKICKIIQDTHALKKPYTLDVLKMESFTNEVYKITHQGETYILRLASPHNGALVFKNTLPQEADNLRKVCDFLDNVPELISFSPHEYALFRYINHKQKLTDSDLKKPEILSKALGFLKTLHTSKIPFENNKDVFKDFRKAIKILETHKVPFNKHQLLKHMTAIEKKLALKPSDSVPIHGDPVASNMLVQENGTLVFIDWEYSGYFDALWDLAMLSVNADFSPTDDKRLLSLYKGSFDQKSYERLGLFKSLVYLWKYFWFILRSLKIKDPKEKASHVKFAQESYDQFLRS